MMIMNVFGLKPNKVYFISACIVLVLMLGFVKYFFLSNNVPLTVKPDSLRLEKSLTRTIANKSKCKGLEFESRIDGKSLTSTCVKHNLINSPYSKASFEIHVFMDKLEKHNFIKKYLKSEIFKEGDYFLIYELPDHGDSPYNPARIKSPHVYSDFPGVLRNFNN